MRVLGVVAVGVLLVACGGDAPDMAPAAKDETTTTTTAETIATTLDSDASTTSAAPVDRASRSYEWFVSPSGRIGCMITKDEARCDVSDYAWSELPPKPSDCEFDWGGTLVVETKSAGYVGCISDSVSGGTDVLGYGEATHAFGFTCRSETSGVECRNDATQHGFEAARTRYRLF